MHKPTEGDLDSLAACISGASTVDEVQAMLETSGFQNILVEPKEESRQFIKDWIPGGNIEDYTSSAVIKAIKP